MSELVLKIQNDLVEAMKNRDELKLSVLRMLKAAIQLAQVEKGKDNPVTDDEVQTILRRLIKQRVEAAKMYSEGGAEERAQSETSEAKVLEAYLPEQLSDEKLLELVRAAAEAVGAASVRDMGKVMGRVMAEVKGQADGNRVKAAVSEFLSKIAG